MAHAKLPCLEPARRAAASDVQVLVRAQGSGLRAQGLVESCRALLLVHAWLRGLRLASPQFLFLTCHRQPPHGGSEARRGEATRDTAKEAHPDLTHFLGGHAWNRCEGRIEALQSRISFKPYFFFLVAARLTMARSESLATPCPAHPAHPERPMEGQPPSVGKRAMIHVPLSSAQRSSGPLSSIMLLFIPFTAEASKPTLLIFQSYAVKKSLLYYGKSAESCVRKTYEYSVPMFRCSLKNSS